MVFSSFFKSKPMISLVLTKEPQNPAQEQAALSSIEARVDRLGSRLQKLKKHSKKVFECNNLETSSAVQACCAKLKKERCKAKKQRAICGAKSGSGECGLGSDSMEIEDFSCGDQLTLSGDSLEECGSKEDVNVEEEEACDNKEKAKCQSQDNPCEEEEEEEEDECEKEIKKCSCQGEEDKDDKCTQVMMFELKGRPYLASKIELKTDVSNLVTAETSLSSFKGSVLSETTKEDVGKKIANHDFVIPIIKTMSVRSLKKSSCSRPRKSDRNLKKIEDETLQSYESQTLQTYNVQSSSGVEMENNSRTSNVKSRRKSRSRSLTRPKSKSSIKKEQILSKEDTLNKTESLQSIPESDASDPDEQHSKVYIVHTPSPKNISRESTIHIDASKVFIQNGTTEIKSGSLNEQQKSTILKKQKSSEKEVVLTELKATTSDKLGSRVSFQQPQLIKSAERQTNLLSKSGTSAESQTLMATSTEMKEESMYDEMEMLQDKFISECTCIKRSQVQFVSDCEMYYSDSGKKILVKEYSKGTSCHSNNQSGSIKSSKNSIGVTDLNPEDNDKVSQNCIPSHSQNSQSAIQVQSIQISGSGFEKKSSNKVSQTLSGVDESLTIKDANSSKKNNEIVPSRSQSKATTSILMNRNEIENSTMEKASFNILNNISGTDKKQQNSEGRQISLFSTVNVENDDSTPISKQSTSGKIKESAPLNYGKATVIPSKSLEMPEMSEMSQKNETITMFVDTTVELPRSHTGKEFIVIHCSKCKEVCVAKIVEKKQPQRDIWVGR